MYEAGGCLNRQPPFFSTFPYQVMSPVLSCRGMFFPRFYAVLVGSCLQHWWWALRHLIPRISIRGNFWVMPAAFWDCVAFCSQRLPVGCVCFIKLVVCFSRRFLATLSSQQALTGQLLGHACGILGLCRFVFTASPCRLCVLYKISRLVFSRFYALLVGIMPTALGENEVDLWPAISFLVCFSPASPCRGMFFPRNLSKID